MNRKPVPADCYAVRTPLQLQQAVRLGGFLRLARMRLIVPPGLGGVPAVSALISRERDRTDAGLQLFSWQLQTCSGPFGNVCTLASRFYDSGTDRLFVRTRVYDRSLALCRNGKPGLHAVLQDVRRDMPYGTAAPNPHCVSSALKSRSGVCQAIAVYLCQLLLRCGYRAVVRVGSLNGVAHAWNQVYWAGAWRRVDLCADAVAQLFSDYCDTTPLSPEEQYRLMTSGLEREVTFAHGAAAVNGLRLPFYLADGTSVCPTRFVQCFNGAWQRKEDRVILALGSLVRSVPLTDLTFGADRLPRMELGAFADLFDLSLSENVLCFREGL